MSKAIYPCDLHTHTVLSDGNDTPYELIMTAAERGVQVLALTDHDVLPPAVIELPDGSLNGIVEWAATQGVCLIRGIEFSCETSVQDVHIVGLDCDWSAEVLRQEEKNIARSKVESYRETVRRLNESGYAMDFEEVLNYASQPVAPESLQKKRIFNLMADKGYAPSWKDAKLLVRDDPYLNVEREKPGGIHIIRAIHDAGGIAILAHPYLIDAEVFWDGKTMSRWDYIEMLISAGLDGIEGRYTYDKTTCKDARSPEEICAEVKRLSAGRLFFSGGSDYHADIKRGTLNQREIGEKGLTMEEFLGLPFDFDKIK